MPNGRYVPTAAACGCRKTNSKLPSSTERKELSNVRHGSETNDLGSGRAASRSASDGHERGADSGSANTGDSGSGVNVIDNPSGGV
jgi:hypothetical protein